MPAHHTTSSKAQLLCEHAHLTAAYAPNTRMTLQHYCAVVLRGRHEYTGTFWDCGRDGMHLTRFTRHLLQPRWCCSLHCGTAVPQRTESYRVQWSVVVGCTVVQDPTCASPESHPCKRPLSHEPHPPPRLAPFVRALMSGYCMELRAMSKSRGLQGTVSNCGGKLMRWSGFGRSNVSGKSRSDSSRDSCSGRAGGWVGE